MELARTSLLADTSLKAYYQLSAGALTTDGSGEGHTLTNGNSVAEAAGKFGGCADLGATDANKYLAIADNLDIDGGACSISLWVKLRTEITVDSTVYNLAMQAGATTDVANFIYYTQAAGVKSLVFSRFKNGVAAQGPSYTVTLGTANWHHIVYTYDTTSVRGYLNSALVGGPTAASGNGSSALSSAFSIGANTADLNSQNALAYIDDVAVFNKALTAAEIHKLYKESTPAFLFNLAGNFKNN